MASHGKRYRNARAAIDRETLYSPLEAIKLLKGAPDTKFDETVEVHFNTGLNVRHAEQQLRGTLMLPHGTGKDVRIAVFAEGEKAKEAEEAGADVVGSADLATQIEGGFDDFDVAIATPDLMGTVGKLGRILGPRGKMPNPKAGTVTFDVAKAVRDSKAGKLEYRTDRGANVHLAIGKKSFSERDLLENYATIARGDRAGEAVGGEGALHPLDHADELDGPGNQDRPEPNPQHRRRAERGGRDRGGVDETTLRRQRQPAARPRGRPAEAARRTQLRLLSCPPPGGPSRLREVQVRKEQKEQVVAGARRAAQGDRHAHRRGLPRPEHDRDRRRPDRAHLARRPLLGREEHADEARRRRGRRAGARPSSSTARPRSRSSTTATWSRSRRR